uniref:hypothetical protein n=1 Tax=Methylobacterium sp. B34 TaxID=95563 RepID=UPI00034D3C11|nr:hypothetical protein [Methylobacterium sp. B34]
MNNHDDASGDDFDAEDAFLKNLVDEDATLSETSAEEHEDEDEDTEVEDAEPSDTEEDEDESSNDPDEDDDEEPKPRSARTDLADDDVITLKVDGEETTVSIRDLKRQWGQHRANDHRSKAIAQDRRNLDEASKATIVAADSLYKRAAEKAAVWEKVDWVGALKNLDAESFNALKAEAERDYADVRFYQDGLNAELERSRVWQAQETESRINATVIELSNPETGITGFGNDVLQEIGSFMQKQGVPQDRLVDLFHAPILRMAYDAMQFNKARAVTSTAKPVVKTAKKIVKGNISSETSRNAAKPGNNSAMKRLERSGSQDDAVAAFLSTLGSRD